MSRDQAGRFIGCLVEVRVARRARRCDGFGCGQTIQDGQRYLTVSLPPGSDPGYTTWIRHHVGICCTQDPRLGNAA